MGRNENSQISDKFMKIRKIHVKITIFYDLKVTSAHLKSTWKCIQTPKIDSVDHFETLIPGKHFLIWAFLGPKSTSKVEWGFEMHKNARK